LSNDQTVNSTLPQDELLDISNISVKKKRARTAVRRKKKRSKILGELLELEKSLGMI